MSLTVSGPIAISTISTCLKRALRLDTKSSHVITRPHNHRKNKEYQFSNGSFQTNCQGVTSSTLNESTNDTNRYSVKDE